MVGFGTTNTTTKVQSGDKEQQWELCLQAWADILQMASIKIVSASSCQAPPSATSSFLWDITGDQICARGADKETSRNCFRDSCQVQYQYLYTISPTCSTPSLQGDSGGSLISSNFGRRCVSDFPRGHFPL